MGAIFSVRALNCASFFSSISLEAGGLVRLRGSRNAGMLLGSPNNQTDLKRFNAQIADEFIFAHGEDTGRRLDAVFPQQIEQLLAISTRQELFKLVLLVYLRWASAPAHRG